MSPRSKPSLIWRNTTPSRGQALDDVVERQIELGAQFADQFLFQGGQGDAHPLRPVRAVLGAAALPPAIDGPIADAKLGNQFGRGGRAGLDVGPNLGRGGVGVQIHAHDARRSMMKDTPRLTPIPLAQSSGTQHEGGGSDARRPGVPYADCR